MKLAQIIKLALCQLDEDLEDAVDYEELFKMYANQGHVIAFEEYYKPRERMMFRSDEHGMIYIYDECRKVIELTDEYNRRVFFEISPDGQYLITGRPDTEFGAFVERKAYSLDDGDAEPGIPETAHPALVDYICYRHLMNGNAAKQQRSQAYYQEFLRAMRRIQPQGAGSVTRTRNLYAATDIRNMRR